MEVNILPFPIAAVPDSRLFRLHCLGHPTPIHVLSQPYVRNAGSIIPHQVDMWIQDDGVDWLVALRQSYREEWHMV